MTIQTSMIVDIVIAVVLVLSVIIGVKRGLLKSLAGVVILTLSFIGASWASQQFAEPVAQWLYPMLEEKIQEYMPQEALPQESASLQDMLEKFNFSGDALQEMVDEIMKNVSDTGTTVFDAATQSVSHSIASALVFLVVFLVLVLVLWLLMQPLHLVMKLPGLNLVNRLGGGALGLIIGALLVFLAVWVMLRFGLLLTPEMVEESFLLKFFANNSPLSLIASL